MLVSKLVLGVDLFTLYDYKYTYDFAEINDS